MRRLNLVLLASLQLCAARSRGFSVNEDLLAFPQFEVVFSEHFISDKDARALLESNDAEPTYSADFSQPTIGEAEDGDAGETPPALEDKRYYEIMNMAPHSYICSIPILQPPGPENQTANELAKAEEARQLSQAAEHGWDLLSDLDEMCLYFMSGWWSYRFCNNREIVQFHAIATLPNGQPPKPDPHSAEYVLGSEPAYPAGNEHSLTSADDAPIPAELQIKGDQRYLMQKLVGGTICDLTGRPRTIEVQYHCVPGMKADRIGWIKEVTICAYIMVINTPRLCNDVAFLPPQETKANPISCQLIVEGETAEPLQIEQNWLDRKDDVARTEEEQIPEDETPQPKTGVVIGGIALGARNVLSGADEAGKPPIKLEPPRSYNTPRKASQERLIEMVARAASQAEGGKYEVLSPEDLQKLDLSPEDLEVMRKEMEKLAGEAGWKVEIVEIPGDRRELRGSVDDEDGPEGKKKGGKPQGDTGRAPEAQGQAKGKKEQEEDEGSEEQFYKEEL